MEGNPVTCIKCGSANVYVRQTRNDGSRRIYRYRHCADCGARFTTVEMPVRDAEKGGGNHGQKHHAGHERVLPVPKVV